MGSVPFAPCRPVAGHAVALLGLFIDIANAIVIKGYLALPIFH
jgi:hypothetical protein